MTERKYYEKVSENEDFWFKYFKSDEIKQLEMIKSLPIFKGLENGEWFGKVTPTLLNSYIKDVIECYYEYISSRKP
jgi:hypothetical protein